MTHFRISFDTAPTNVEAVDSVVSPMPPPEPVVDARLNEKATQLIANLTKRLQEIEITTASSLEQINTRVTEIAIDLARIVLNEDNTIVNQRVVEYAKTAFEQMKPQHPKTITVHPDCKDTISAWIDDSGGPQLEVRVDPTVAPGDCRIENAEIGAVASLESFLTTAREKLTQT